MLHQDLPSVEGVEQHIEASKGDRKISDPERGSIGKASSVDLSSSVE